MVSKIYFRGRGRLNFNSQLLPIKYSDFVFNLLKVCIDNVFYVSVSCVGVFFFSNLFRFDKMGCFKENSVKKAKKCSFSNRCFSLICPLPYIFIIIQIV